MEIKKVSIVWFQEDLRLQEHPALAEACAHSLPIVPLYILDENRLKKRK